MRSTRRTTRATTALPAAIAGSIALTLVGAPANAAEPAAALERVADKRPSTPAAVSSVARPTTYTVLQGDTVSSIAARFGLRTTDVLTWNHLGWSSIIRPGQVLRLTAPGRVAPAPAAKTKTYVVRQGDTVSAIARRLGVSVTRMLAANGLGWSSIIVPGQRLKVPGDAAPAAAAPMTRAAAAVRVTAYVVRAGDTVSAIAARHGVGIPAILAANRLAWGSIIYPGQKLVIPAEGGVAGLSSEQVANARLIIRIGRALGVPDRGIAIALGTAMQESGLRNLGGGDRDSRGLFQQRPSTGWGTAAQVHDAARATRAFFGGPSDPNGPRTRGLLDIPGWRSMSFAGAAQAVQISAYPDLYARWEKPAEAWLAALG